MAVIIHIVSLLHSLSVWNFKSSLLLCLSLCITQAILAPTNQLFVPAVMVPQLFTICVGRNATSWSCDFVYSAGCCPVGKWPCGLSSDLICCVNILFASFAFRWKPEDVDDMPSRHTSYYWLSNIRGCLSAERMSGITMDVLTDATQQAFGDGQPECTNVRHIFM